MDFYILNCSDLNESTLNSLSIELKKEMDVNFKIFNYKFDFSFAFNQIRMQYNADLLLKKLRENFDKRFICIFPHDIYVENMNFIFGLAELNGRGGIVSIFRLKDKNFHERLLKEMKHEIGHIFGLKHCENKCVMNFSNSLYDVDRKPDYFCSHCLNELRNRIGQISLIE